MGDCESHFGRNLDGYRFALDVERVAFRTVDEIIFGIGDDSFVKVKLFVRFVVHEMVAGAVVVEVLAFFAQCLQSFHGFAGAKSDFD